MKSVVQNMKDCQAAKIENTGYNDRLPRLTPSCYQYELGAELGVCLDRELSNIVISI